MHLFARISNAVIMNLDKHQLCCLLLVVLLFNKTAAHTQYKTNTVLLYSFFGWFPGVWILFANFRNTISVPSSCLHRLSRWNRVLQNVCKYISDDRESPKRKNTTFRTWRKFVSRNTLFRFIVTPNWYTTVIKIHQSVYSSHIWKTSMCTKDSNMNWEWTLFGILISLQFRCFLFQVYSTAPSPRVALRHVIGLLNLKEDQRLLQNKWQGCLTVLLTQAKTLSSVSGNRMHTSCTVQTLPLK